MGSATGVTEICGRTGAEANAAAYPDECGRGLSVTLLGVLSLEDVRRRGRFKEGFELPADIVVYVRLRGKGGTQEKPESKKQRPQHGAGEAGRCVFDGL